MVLWRLLISTLAFHKVRCALTITAIALAISLVVAVTSGYSSGEAAVQQFVRYYVGASNIEISPKGDTHQVFGEELTARIAEDGATQDVAGRLESSVVLGDGAVLPLSNHPAAVTGVVLPGDAQVMAMKLTQGEWFRGESGDVAVIDQVVAERMRKKVGDTLVLLHPERPLKVRVVGIVHKPVMLALHTQSMYVPLRTLQQFLGREGKVSRALVDLKPGEDQEAFAQRWEPRLAKMEPELRLRRSGQRRQEMQQGLGAVRFLSYMGGTVAMGAAMFIVFATLSMGVSERSRTLAMLRAVGAQRRQVGMLVVLEGMLLAAGGAAAGVPLGLLWLHLLARWHASLFAAGVVISAGGLLYGVLGMIVAALVASFMPAWTAMRVSPLEAMAPLGQAGRARSPWICAAAGVVLASIDPLLIFWPGMPRDMVFYLHVAIGVPGLFVGFFLLAPTFVWVVERSFGYVVSVLLRLDHTLLRQQLSGSLWRSAGTAAALMVGLAILVVLQVQGKSVIGGWQLPDKFPDVFIVAPIGLDRQQQRVLESAPGIRPGQVLPIAISSPQLGLSLFKLGSTGFLPDATMFFGIDPDKAMQMIEFEFRDGNAQDAARMLKMGRHLIVTNEFRELKGMKVGDKLPLKTPMNGTVDYTIAGVVWSPGLDVIISAFDMGRQLEQRTALSVCGSLEDARRDFGIERVNLFAANLEIGVQREDLAATLSGRMEEPATRPGATSPTTAPGGIMPAGFSMAQLRSLLGRWGFLVGDVRHIKFHMQQEFKELLMAVSSVALAAILVASLGVTNTIMASIRSRQWQFGIFRSVGLTRWQLLRIILAEAILLGLVGCGLGLAAGFLLAMDAHGLNRVLIGYTPPVIVPWDIIWLGAGIIMAVAVVASLWPAISSARRRPLELLQWGRAAG